MKILIIGATGLTGRELVKQSVAAGHSVSVLVRDLAKADFPAEVTRHTGDVLRRESLDAALAGQEAVISSLGSTMSGPFKSVSLFSEGTRHLLDAMKAAGTRRLICITGIGAGDSRGHGGFAYDRIVLPLLLRGVYEDKDRQEALVRASGLDWTLVRPAMLNDDPPKGDGGYCAVTDLKDIYGGKISRADVAGFCLRELTEGRFRNRAPLLLDA